MIQTEKSRENYREFLETLEAKKAFTEIYVEKNDYLKVFEDDERQKDETTRGLSTNIKTEEITKNDGSTIVSWLDNADIKEMSIKEMKSESCDHIVVSNLTEASLRAMRQDGITTATICAASLK